jgi:uncharacterized protein (DUF952 family)
MAPYRIRPTSSHFRNRLVPVRGTQHRYACHDRPPISVIFHLATPEDWERASRRGVYTTASLHDRGFVGCATATQNAAVANARFAGRGDLVRLLIDTERLSSQLRFEPPTADGEAFPHIYGPVHLDAIFEATPYRSGPDGRFSPHEEASGFAAHGAATLAATGRRAAGLMAGFAGRWWVAAMVASLAATIVRLIQADPQRSRAAALAASRSLSSITVAPELTGRGGVGSHVAFRSKSRKKS